MTREEQIIEAAEKATYQKPPQYSELVHKSRKVMSAYEVGFIDGCVWADQHPQWIPVEERLPEEGQVVFIYTKHGSVSSVTYKDGAFNLNEVLEAINVTHWMPIVPPRKEE